MAVRGGCRYRKELNIISPDYDMKRPRILKGVTDYNQLKK